MSSHSVLYHVSDKFHDTLKSKSLITPNNPDLTEQDTRISFLLTPFTKKDISEYQKTGFKPWDMKHAYLYIIDPSTLTDEDYHYAKMESTPEQQEYDLKHWKREVSNVSDNELKEAMTKYFEKRKKYLDDRFDIPAKGDIDTFLEHPNYFNWSSSRWITYNLKTGNLNQYATNIPHMQISVKHPIAYQEVIRLF